MTRPLRPATVILAAYFGITGILVSADDLNCLKEDERTASRLYQRLQHDAYAALDRRADTFENLKSMDDIRDYQRRLRAFFVEQLGGFPDARR